jgi:hypothetical protein
MSEAAYVSRSAQAEMPDGLRTKTRSHDAVQSRSKRRIIPAKQEGSVNGTDIFVFDIASNAEWLDLATARLVFTLNVTKGSTDGYHAPAGGSWASLFRTYELTCKGQSLADAKQDVDIYNALRLRMRGAPAAAVNYDQVDAGMWSQVAESYVYQFNRRAGGVAGGNSQYTVAIPLADVVEELGMERSYLPAYALPMKLNLRMNSLVRAFAGAAATDLPTAAAITEMAIEVDGMMMAPEIDEAFRGLVVDSGVSFYYPHTSGLQQAAATGTVNLRTNQVATCLNRGLVWLTQPEAADSVYPYASNALDATLKQAMGGFQWNAFVDGRNVFSEPIRSVASLMGELKRADNNVGDKKRLQAPIISSAGFMEGATGGTAIGASGATHLRDINACIFPVCFQRELVDESVSGLNVALTGGNLSFNLSGVAAAANRNAYLFLTSTRQISLSASFLSVIR